MNLRGTLPTLILEALEHQPDHGYSIAQRIKKRSRAVLDFKEGTLYPALHKLEREGLVESYEDVEKGTVSVQTAALHDVGGAGPPDFRRQDDLAGIPATQGRAGPVSERCHRTDHPRGGLSRRWGGAGAGGIITGSARRAAGYRGSRWGGAA